MNKIEKKFEEEGVVLIKNVWSIPEMDNIRKEYEYLVGKAIINIIDSDEDTVVFLDNNNRIRFVDVADGQVFFL